MRSGACDTPARHRVRSVLCRYAFPLASALRSTNSAADRSALFAGFTATMASSDFPRPCIIGYGSSPSRCGPPAFNRRPDVGSPKFQRDPSIRDVALDPGRVAMPRIAAPLMLRSTFGTGLRLCGMPISWLNPTPHTAAVYASWPALPSAHATLASRRLATPYLGWTCTS
jgi:hypothetical protein